MRLSARVALTVVGVLAAVGIPLGWSLADHPSGARQLDAGTAVRLADSTPSGSASPTPSVSTRVRATAPPVRPAPKPPVSRPAPLPVRISIPSIGVDAPVVAVGVDAKGDMAIPEKISTIGWYEYGPVIGSGTGSTVLSGHVDSAKDGLGAFFYLRTVTLGARVDVALAGGPVRHYKVVAREEFPKTSVPLDKLFARNGPERLTLITCGGAFDRQARSYYDNIVVTAVPV